MSDSNTPDPKKDLTGIFDLPKTAVVENDPFAVEAPPAEHVDAFESIDELGMTDHGPAKQEATENISGADLSGINPIPENTPPENTQVGQVEQTATQLLPRDIFGAETTTTIPGTEDIHPSTEAHPDNAFLDDLKNYSEKSQGPVQEIVVHYPFHFYVEGTFGPFERDKLLLFITENNIGVSSSDLDLQIKGGRVLFPRISEFAGIKLIQDLRDSGLSFKLLPSARDADETFPQTPPLHYHYDSISAARSGSALSPIVLVASNSAQLQQYHEVDTVQASQFLKAEMVEAEKSELFQEVLERMTEALKQKARLKGGQALTHFEQKIVALRLPSQYQLSVRATVLKKIN